MKQDDLVIPASQRAMYDRFHFAPAVRTGGLLLCSGQIGVGPDGRAIADPAAQFTAAFEGVREILAEAKLDFSDVAELTTFHVGMREHLGAFMAVKDRYLPAPFPAWTAIGVSELAFPGALAEVRVTARLRAPAARAKQRAKPRAAKRARRKPARKR
jgi:enamine deaminase RidA (YjgF/YER057c/UK114 family)